MQHINLTWDELVRTALERILDRVLKAKFTLITRGVCDSHFFESHPAIAAPARAFPNAPDHRQSIFTSETRSLE
jgi:hypothetical protein